jgi:hypothetical protein
MDTITVHTTAGHYEVPAERQRNLAIHELCDDGLAPGWRVTHVPTGFAIVIGIAEKDDAVECTAQLNALHSWDFVCDQQGAIPIVGEEVALRVREIGEACGGLVARRN